MKLDLFLQVTFSGLKDVLSKNKLLKEACEQLLPIIKLKNW